MKKDVFDNRYKYYFYETDDVDKCLNDGIEIIGGNQLGLSVGCSFNGDGENIFLKQLDNFNNNIDCNNVIVVRIPLYYMGWVHRNGVKESFVPIFKCIYDKSDFCVRTFLISELIFGVYDKNSKEFKYNDNYNVFYDPNGLQFSDEQIGNMYNYGCFNLYKNAFDRKKYTYEELKNFDINCRLWEKTMSYYKAPKIKKLILNFNKNNRGRR